MPSDVTPRIIKIEQISKEDKPKFQAELSQRVENCDITGFLGAHIQLDSEIVEVKGFNARLCQRKGKKIWVVQEPICRFYRSFLDHSKYPEHQDNCFGICNNMKDTRQREMYGCIFSRKYGIYIPINHPNEEYVFIQRDWSKT